MKRLIIAMYILGAGLLAGTGTVLAIRASTHKTIVQTSQSQPSPTPNIIATLHNEVNTAREQAKLPDLAYSQALQSAAQARCTDMVTNNYYAHVSPSGEQYYEFFKPYISVDPADIATGENIAEEWSINSAYTDWMNSPGHKANILNANYDSEGLAYCYIPTKYNYYVVEDFAHLAPAPTSLVTSSSTQSSVDCATEQNIAAAQLTKANSVENSLHETELGLMTDPASIAQENLRHQEVLNSNTQAGAAYLASIGC